MTIPEDGNFSLGVSDLNATDADTNSSQLFWSLKQAPANGIAEVNGTGSFPQVLTYFPDLNYNGTDSFVVRVHDLNDTNASDEITVNVTISSQPDPPFFTSTPIPAALKDYQYAYMIHIDDPDGVTGVLVSDPTASLPSWLNLSILGDGLGILSGTPTGSDLGTFSVSLLAQDPDGLNAMQTFDIVVVGVNSPPVIVQGPEVNATMDEDGIPLAWQVPELNATDSNGHLLFWSILVAPTNGTAVVSGTGDNPSVFSYDPNPHFNGQDSFVVKVTDGIDDANVTVRVSVNPQPDAPSFLSTPVTTIVDGNNYVYDVCATDPDGLGDCLFPRSIFDHLLGDAPLNLVNAPGWK